MRQIIHVAGMSSGVVLNLKDIIKADSNYFHYNIVVESVNFYGWYIVRKCCLPYCRCSQFYQCILLSQYATVLLDITQLNVIIENLMYNKRLRTMPIFGFYHNLLWSLLLLLNRKKYPFDKLHKLFSPAMTNQTAKYIASLPCLASFLIYQVLTIPVLRCILVLSIKLALMAKYSRALQLYFHLA